MEIALNDGNLRYSGRIDRHDPLRPEWVFPATSLYFRYSGGGAALTVENRRVCWDNCGRTAEMLASAAQGRHQDLSDGG